jgi:hypothetical protein
VDTLKLSLGESAAILSQLAPGFADESCPPPVVQSWPLGDAPAAYVQLQAGKATAKIVFVP